MFLTNSFNPQNGKMQQNKKRTCTFLCLCWLSRSFYSGCHALHQNLQPVHTLTQNMDIWIKPHNKIKLFFASSCTKMAQSWGTCFCFVVHMERRSVAYSVITSRWNRRYTSLLLWSRNVSPTLFLKNTGMLDGNNKKTFAHLVWCQQCILIKLLSIVLHHHLLQSFN